MQACCCYRYQVLGGGKTLWSKSERGVQPFFATPLKTKGPLFRGPSFVIPGGFLLSHAVAHAVPSAQRSLTSVFGMGTGITSSLLPPGNPVIYINQ